MTTPYQSPPPQGWFRDGWWTLHALEMVMTPLREAGVGSTCWPSPVIVLCQHIVSAHATVCHHLSLHVIFTCHCHVIIICYHVSSHVITVCHMLSVVMCHCHVSSPKVITSLSCVVMCHHHVIVMCHISSHVSSHVAKFHRYMSSCIVTSSHAIATFHHVIACHHCVTSHVSMHVHMYAVICCHFSGHSRTFYCLLTLWCVGGAEEFPSNTPCIPARAVSMCCCRQASLHVLRADLCPVLPIRQLRRSGTAIFIPCRLSAPSSHMKAQYDLKQSVFILNSFRISYQNVLSFDTRSGGSEPTAPAGVCWASPCPPAWHGWSKGLIAGCCSDEGQGRDKSST